MASARAQDDAVEIPTLIPNTNHEWFDVAATGRDEVYALGVPRSDPDNQ